MYYISYYINGKRKWKSTGQRAKAAALAALTESRSSKSPATLRISLEKFYEEFLQYAQVTYSKKTVIMYEHSLRKFMSLVGRKLLSEVTPKDADLYRGERSKDVSPVSVNVELRTLRAAFYTALRRKLIAENPFARMRLAQVPEAEPVYFTREDFDRLLRVVRDSWLRDLMLVAVSTGLRKGELLNLTW